VKARLVEEVLTPEERVRLGLSAGVLVVVLAVPGGVAVYAASWWSARTGSRYLGTILRPGGAS